MKHQYIVDYEVWANGQAIGWTTMDIVVETNGEAPDAHEFVVACRKSAAKHCSCKEDQIRIRGVWKL
jgi:hypothetical protein